MVKGAPKEDKAVSDFMKFCEGSVLVAHNALFDTGFIPSEPSRAAVKRFHIVLLTQSRLAVSSTPS